MKLRDAIEALSAEFPADVLDKKKTDYGKDLSFVPLQHVIRRANEIAPDYDFEVRSSESFRRKGTKKKRDAEGKVVGEEPIEYMDVVVLGRLTVRFEDATIVKEQYGGSDSRGNDMGDTYKGAASDAEKKCWVRFGIALYLWDEGAKRGGGSGGSSGGGGNGGRTNEENADRPASSKMLGMIYGKGKSVADRFPNLSARMITLSERNDAGESVHGLTWGDVDDLKEQFDQCCATEVDIAAEPGSINDTTATDPNEPTGGSPPDPPPVDDDDLPF